MIFMSDPPEERSRDDPHFRHFGDGAAKRERFQDRTTPETDVQLGAECGSSAQQLNELVNRKPGV
jgi:hypothetical protein